MTAGASHASPEPRPPVAAPPFAARAAVPAVAPLRVLHVYGGRAYGGVESFLRVLARGGPGAPATAEFALCTDGPLASDLRAERVAVHVVGEARLREPASVRRARGSLTKLLQSRTYDVVVCHSAAPHAVFAPAVRAAGVPLVHFMHDVPHRGSWLDLWAHRAPPDLVLCSGALTREAGRWLFGPVPRRVVVPWVDRDHLPSHRASRSDVRASLETGSDAVVILQASRMKESKGHRLLLGALARIASDPRWVCWIAGRADGAAEGAYEADLRRRARRSGLADRIRFVGFERDMPSLMSAADVLCRPSVRSEPSAMALVEALASGLPVVATRLGAAIELVTPACGRLVDASPAALARALSTLVGDGDERARLARGGPPRAGEIGEPEQRVNDLATTLARVVPCRMSHFVDGPSQIRAEGGDRRPAHSLSSDDSLGRGEPLGASVSSTSAARSGEARVLHIHSGNLQGGVETYLRTLAQSASLCPGLSMEFALCFERRLSRELREAGAPLHMMGPLRIRFPNRVLAARWKLARTLAAANYDAVITHSVWSHAIFGPVVRARGSRLVYHMHDIPNMSSWLDRWASYVQPDAVLCYTHYLADSGRALFAGVPRHVVPPPSRLDRRGPAVGREQVRASLGVQPGQVVILCASRLEAWKGHRLLVQALAEMRDEPRWTCWIAGGPQRASEIAYDTALRDEVARLGLSERVHFLGQRTDMPDLLGGADIHCQPNTSPEPFGQVFVEALTAGLPVVTTDMGGGREIVTPDCGILVPPDPASVARSLRRLVVDDTLRTTLAQAAPARAKELCDPATRMHQLADVMVGLAASGLSSGTWRTATASHDPPLVVLVAEALAEMGCTFDDVVDLGCGRGAMARRLAGVYRRYLGCDAVRDPAFPDSPSVRFRAVDLARGPYPVDAASADVVLSATATERLADPRTLLREMARVVRPGGWVLVGAHRALGPPRQEALLRKAAVESGLVDIEVRSDRPSLFPLVAAIWPRGRRPRRRSFAKDLVLLARRP